MSIESTQQEPITHQAKEMVVLKKWDEPRGVVCIRSQAKFNPNAISFIIS